MPIYLGLDCGGTSARALAVDENGTVVHEGRSGPANLASTPQEKIEQHLKEAIEGCPKVDAAVGGFAGLLTEADRRRACKVIRSLCKGAKVDAIPDWAIALAAAGPEFDGLFIAGTGSVVCSRKHSGYVKSGAGGPIIGDVGSVFAMCQRAIALTLLEPEGLPMTQRLQNAMQEAYGASDEDGVLAYIYSQPSPAKEVCRLGNAVAQDAADGVAYAVRASDSSDQDLAGLVVRHFTHYHPELKTARIAGAGGLFRISHHHEARLQAMMNGELQTGHNAKSYGLELPAHQTVEFTVTAISPQPVEGAILVAKGLIS
jgi:glucosamine kinase